MRTRQFRLWMACASMLLLHGQGVFGANPPKLQTLDQYTRIQLPVLNGSNFRLVSGGGEAVITIDRVSVGALEQANAFSDHRVRGVSVKRTGADQAEVTVKYAGSGMESFAYLQGGNLVLDLWQQPGSAATAKAAPAAASAPSAKPAAAQAPAVRSRQRKPAAVASSSPSEKVAPLSREQDLFQRFILPMPELRVAGGKSAFDLPPKAEIEGLWRFSQGNKGTEAGRTFNYAKKLFDEKKYGLALKTIEIGQRDFPDSPYADEMKFLEAICYRKLGEVSGNASLAKRSEDMLAELGARLQPNGKPLPFGPSIRLYFGKKEYQAGNWLQAIPHLEYVAQLTPAGEPTLPFVQLMLADAYGKVSQPRRAERIYRFLAEKLPAHVAAREAKYRIGSLLAQERNYERVVEEGVAAIRAYPEYEKSRSEILFQMGEASFWLGRYQQAERYFRRYTEISSANTNSALAWVRLGEIAELQKKDVNAARAAYLRAKNGYPFSQGDLVASVRLARIDLPVEKEPAFVVKTLSDMLADKTIDGDLRRMAELTLSSYLLLTGDVDKAISLARDGLAQTDGTAYEAYKRAYMEGLFAKLEIMNREKRYADALALYDKERKWIDLKGADASRALAETYKGLGLYATANELMARYEREAWAGRGLASRANEEAVSLIQARNSFAKGDYAEALQKLPDDDEAGVLYIRALSEFRMGRKREGYQAARKLIGACAKGCLPDSSLSEIAEIMIDRSSSEVNFPRMEKEVSSVRALMSAPDERITYAAADALWLQRKHQPAIDAYRAAIESFPAGERAERAKYKIGMSLVSLGKREEAVKQLTELAASSQSIWADSARQELELINWEKKYSSVLRTLPPAGLGIAD